LKEALKFGQLPLFHSQKNFCLQMHPLKAAVPEKGHNQRSNGKSNLTKNPKKNTVALRPPD